MVYSVDHNALWKDARYFGQISTTSSQDTPSDGSLEGEIYSVAKRLLGDSYELDTVNPDYLSSGLGFEVFDILTQLLPTLSPQSAFYWNRPARSLASMLSTAKYPIRSQASHLIFWWARLGGMMGPITLHDRVGLPTDCTSDGSLVEFSWVLPRETDTSDRSNRRIRFCIDPFHPETCVRVSGSAALDWLWSREGNMGLVKQESKKWKDIIEKWLFPDIKDSNEVVPGCTYMIAFDMGPAGDITLKMYYIPPLAPSPTSRRLNTTVAYYRRTTDLSSVQRLVPDLHPSLEEPCRMLCEYLDTQRGVSALHFFMIACDITKLEKNRLKLYFFTSKTTLKEIMHDMTLGGALTGPLLEDAMLNFKKFFIRLFPYAENEDTHIASDPDKAKEIGRKGLRIMYYYEFFVGHPTPFPKIYFFMDHFSQNDLDTARAVELFLRDVGKNGKEGWLSDALAHANLHRSLEDRNGLHAMVSFGTKPTGWEVTTYYSAEIYAPEREVGIKK